MNDQPSGTRKQSYEDMVIVQKFLNYIDRCRNEDEYKEILSIGNRLILKYKTYRQNNPIPLNTEIASLGQEDAKIIKELNTNLQFKKLKELFLTTLSTLEQCSIPELQELFIGNKILERLGTQQIASMLKQLDWQPKTNGKQRWWVKTPTPQTACSSQDAIDNMEI